MVCMFTLFTPFRLLIFCSNPFTWFKPFNVSLHLDLCGFIKKYFQPHFVLQQHSVNFLRECISTLLPLIQYNLSFTSSLSYLLLWFDTEGEGGVCLHRQGKHLCGIWPTWLVEFQLNNISKSSQVGQMLPGSTCHLHAKWKLFFNSRLHSDKIYPH